jgi:Zn-dependent peptidase ImmA (M78 family)
MTDMGPVILYERRLTVPRQRFVIAHALAHLLFDLKDPSAMCGIGHRGDPDAEKRADDFAAELLLPLEWLHRIVGEEPTPIGESNDTLYMDQVDEIASMFNVTQSLVDSRIRSLFR